MELTPTLFLPVAKPILLHIFLAMLLVPSRSMENCHLIWLVNTTLSNPILTTVMHVRSRSISERLILTVFKVPDVFTLSLEPMPLFVLNVWFSRLLLLIGPLGISWSLRCPWPSTSRGSYVLAGWTRRRTSGGTPASSPGPSSWPSSRS